MEDLAAEVAYRPRVLIVDSARDHADMLVILCERRRLEASAAYDGPGALALAQTFHPQLALFDIGLPDVSSLARAFRADECLSRCALIALSGLTRAEAASRVRFAGFDAYMTRPVDFNKFFDCISRLLGRRAPEARPDVYPG